MKRGFFSLAFLALIFLFFGCAHHEVGKKFYAEAAQKIEIGKTTESEVLALLGEPIKKTVKPDGTKIYGYYHIESKVVYVWGSSSGNMLVVTFDKNGIVSGLSRSTVPGHLN
jgi:hypothetical protein